MPRCLCNVSAVIVTRLLIFREYAQPKATTHKIEEGAEVGSQTKKHNLESLSDALPPLKSTDKFRKHPPTRTISKSVDSSIRDGSHERTISIEGLLPRLTSSRPPPVTMLMMPSPNYVYGHFLLVSLQRQ
jgi:hypothetical protein